jgi:hypothetical protein
MNKSGQLVASSGLVVLMVFAWSSSVNGQSGSRADSAVLQKLIYDLSRNAVTERAQAVATLKEMGPAAREALPMLRSAYAREARGPIKVMMLEAIRAIEGGGQTGQVIRPTDLKAVARQVLVLSQMLGHANPVQQRKALAGVRKLGAFAEPLLPKITSKAKSDPDAVTQRMAKLTLRTIEQQRWFVSKSGTPNAESDTEPKSTQQINSVDQLISLLEKRLGKVVEQLAGKLGDPSKIVRMKAVRQLTQMAAAAEQALPTLQKMASGDEDTTVRRAAGLAVRNISKAQEETRFWYQKQGKASKGSYTTSQVNAVRKSSGFDARAMKVNGVVGVGTGGGTSKSIVVMCKDGLAAQSARKVLGDQLQGISIRYQVTGSSKTR